MLEIENVTVRYGNIEVLRDVSVRVDQGEVVALIGANGAGKSTLLRVITGLLKPSRGRISYKGTDLSRMEPHDIVHLGIVLVPEGRALFADMTVEENLLMGSYGRRAASHCEENSEIVYSLFPVLKQRRRQDASTLSGGEQQMLAVSRGFMAHPEMLLLDEASWGLSPLLADHIYSYLKEFTKRGIAIIVSEQNARLALKSSQRAYLLSRGEVALTGSSQYLLANPEVKRHYMGVV